MGSFIIDIIDVSSGKLAFAVTLILIFPFIYKNNKRLSKFIKSVCIILSSIATNIFLNVEYHYDLGRLGFYFQINYILISLIIIIITLYILSNKLLSNHIKNTA